MKETDKKALLKLGAVAMLLILGMALVEAMALNSVVGCTGGPGGTRSCTASDPNGTDRITVWDKNTSKKVVQIKNQHGFSPTFLTFSIPATGDYIIALRDQEKPPEKDFWIVNSTGTHGPMSKKPKKGDP